MPNPNLPNNPGYNLYVGARYVPLFDGQWDATKAYEPLTIVQYLGDSYTSKTFVPIGVVPTNETYWVLTGQYNAQIEDLRGEIANNSADIEELKTSVQTIDTDLTAVKTKNGEQDAAIQGNQNSINSLETRVTENESDITSVDTRVAANTESIGNINNSIATINAKNTAQDTQIAQIQTRLNNNKIINVLDNGLVADGTTDNSAALVSLLNTIPVYSTIYFPDGNYYFGSPINIDKQGVVLMGAKSETVLYFNTDGIKLNSYYTGLVDLTVLCNGISVEVLSSYCFLESFSCKNNDSYTSTNNVVVGSTTNFAWMFYAHNVKINNQTTGTKTGYAFLINKTSNAIISDVYIAYKNTGFYFPAVEDSFAVDGIQISNVNVLHSVSAFDIRSGGSVFIDNLIADDCNTNIFNLNNVSKIYLNNAYLGSGSGGTSNTTPLRITNSTNVFVNNTKLAGTPSAYLLVVNGGSNITLSNMAISNGTNAITLQNTPQNVVIQNVSVESVTSKLYAIGSLPIVNNLHGDGTVSMGGNTGVSYIRDVAVQCGTSSSVEFTIPEAYGQSTYHVLTAKNTPVPVVCTYTGNTGKLLTADGSNFNNQTIVVTVMDVIF